MSERRNGRYTQGSERQAASRQRTTQQTTARNAAQRATQSAERQRTAQHSAEPAMTISQRGGGQRRNALSTTVQNSSPRSASRRTAAQRTSVRNRTVQESSPKSASRRTAAQSTTPRNTDTQRISTRTAVRNNRPEQESTQTATGRLSRIRQRRLQNRRMIVGISFVVAAFCIVMGIQMVGKYNTLRKLHEQEAKLQKQYEKELQLSEELKDQESYVKTDDYVEEMARKLGLLYPNEVIFKPEE